MGKRHENNKMAKEYIVSALISLMKNEDYGSISITDIAEKAGVSRMAYYRNYASKDDILNTYIDEVGCAIHQKIAEDVGCKKIYRYYLAIFEELGKHGDVGVAICNAHLGELILHHIKKGMRETFPFDANDELAEYRIAFLAGAIYSVYTEWLKGGQTQSCAQLADVCCRMTEDGCPEMFGERDAEN